MIKENALVIDYQNGIAKVKCQTQSACGSCTAQAACGTSALSKLTGEKQHIFSLASLTPLQAGQIVEIGLPQRSIVFSALLLYFIPLLSILVSAFAAQYLFASELVGAIFIFFCTALTLLAVRHYAKKIQKKSAFQPILLRVIG